MSDRRVVVTGLGAITPVGLTVSESWSQLLNGVSGIEVLEHLPEDLPVRIGGQVPSRFDPLTVVSKKDVKKMGRFILLALHACKEALTDAGLEDLDCATKEKTGVIIGVGLGDMPLMEKQSELTHQKKFQSVSAFFIPALIGNLAAGQISIRHQLKGPNYSITSACASGNHSIGEGYLMIKNKTCDLTIVGGAESCLSPLGYCGFNSMRALSKNPDPKKASRPWDKDRDGFVMSEGSGVLILEDYTRAQKRNAPIYAEVVGYGMSSDGYHITNPSPEGMGASLAIERALQEAQISPDKIDYVNAHGTSTPHGDVVECQALHRVLGSHTSDVLINSTKSFTGHTLGASGAIESVVSIMSLKEQKLHATDNLDNPGEGCDLNFVQKESRDAKINYVLNNSFGFGGTNACLIFKKIS